MLYQGGNSKPTSDSTNNPVCIGIDIDGNIKTITDPKEIVEEFNKHYATVATKILKKRKF